MLEDNTLLASLEESQCWLLKDTQKKKKRQGYSESSSPARLGDHDAILQQYQRSENFSFPRFPLEEDSDEIEKNFSLEIKFRVFVVT